MGHVTKTIVESTGEIITISTTYSFETYEDFAKRESQFSAQSCPNEGIISRETLGELVNNPDEDGWIMHDGKGPPDSIKESLVDIVYKDGIHLESKCHWLTCGWDWEEDPESDDQVLKYRIHKEKA